ncbi:hypothetical protein [Albibacterium indicum]|uniref:hypothetical protein n=1 Tax=Albibacterium indicum TaxID=2292082 RepID=UPI0013009599|nr:hypothetical protein [Pedobacter indicus]
MKDHKDIEENYPENQQNPGPSEEAVTEKDDKPASRTLNWVIIIAVVILAIIIFMYYY